MFIYIRVRRRGSGLWLGAVFCCRSFVLFFCFLQAVSRPFRPVSSSMKQILQFQSQDDIYTTLLYDCYNRRYVKDGANVSWKPPTFLRAAAVEGLC